MKGAGPGPPRSRPRVSSPPASNTCTLDQFNARTCNFLIRSDWGAKPRKVSSGGVAAGSYDLLIANFAGQQESLSALVTLSSATCPALAVGSRAGAAGGREVGVAARGLFSR